MIETWKVIENSFNIKGISALNKAVKNHTLYHGYYWKKGELS